MLRWGDVGSAYGEVQKMYAGGHVRIDLVTVATLNTTCQRWRRTERLPNLNGAPAAEGRSMRVACHGGFAEMAPDGVVVSTSGRWCRGTS